MRVHLSTTIKKSQKNNYKMSTQNLKFIHLSTGSASAHKADTGAIIFEKATGRIAVAAGADTDVEYYGGGRVSDAKFENSILTISFNDTAETIKLDFSDVASTSGVHAVLQPLANRVKTLEGRADALEGRATTLESDVDALEGRATALETKVGDENSGLVKEVADNKAAIAGNKAAIDAINDKSTGILAQAKSYTDGKVSDINAVTSGLRSDLGNRGEGKGTAFARIEALEGTVGDASKGLVKGVADNAAAITALQGLHKDGADGKMTVEQEVTAGVNAKVGDIKLNDAAVTVKEYVDAGDAKALADAKSYTDTEIGKVNTAAETLGGRVNALEGVVGDDSKGLVKKVNTLIGEDADKSVRAISADEVAKVVASAPEDFDTLKEIADWIANDKTGAAAMQSDIATLKTTVGNDDSGLVKKVNDNATAISGNSNAIDALEALHAKDGQTMKSVATEVSEGIAGIVEHSETNDKADPKSAGVVVTVTTKAGSVSGVAVDASILAGKVSANTTAIATEKSRAEGVESGLRTDVDGIRSDLGESSAAASADTAFGRIKALEEKQSSGTLMWSVWA